MSFEIDRTMLPTRDWVEGMDGGRNVISKVLFGLLGAGLVAFGVGLAPAMDHGALRWGFLLSNLGAGVALVVVALFRPWRWPTPGPTVLATIGDVRGPDLSGASEHGPGVSRGLRFGPRRGVVVGGRWVIAVGLVMYAGMGLRILDAVARAIRDPGRHVVTLVVGVAWLAVLAWVVWASIKHLRTHRGGFSFVVLSEGLGTALDCELADFIAWDELEDVSYRFQTYNSARGIRVLVASGGARRVLAGLEAFQDHPSTLIYAARHYAEHPEDRAELADGRAIARLQDLLDRGAPYADSALPD